MIRVTPGKFFNYDRPYCIAVGVLLHCLLADQCRQQITSCTVVVLWWTRTTVGCQFLLHLLLHHMQSSHSSMDAEVPKLCALSFPGIYYTVLEIMGILAVAEEVSFELWTERWCGLIGSNREGENSRCEEHMNENPVIQCEFEFVTPTGTGHQKGATVELVFRYAEDKRDNWADWCK